MKIRAALTVRTKVVAGCRCLKAAILATVVNFTLPCFRRVSSVPTVTGMAVVLNAVLTTLIAFEASHCCRILQVATGFVMVLIL